MKWPTAEDCDAYSYGGTVGFGCCGTSGSAPTNGASWHANLARWRMACSYRNFCRVWIKAKNPKRFLAETCQNVPTRFLLPGTRPADPGARSGPDAGTTHSRIRSSKSEFCSSSAHSRKWHLLSQPHAINFSRSRFVPPHIGARWPRRDESYDGASRWQRTRACDHAQRLPWCRCV